MGWVRLLHYYNHRLFRSGDSTYKITAGLATGVAISFSPFLGTHFFQTIFITWLIKANMFAGFAGTVWGNPWTFPFIFMLSYKVGIFICMLFGASDSILMPSYMTFEYFSKEPVLFLSYIFSNPIKLLLPLTIGGYICALICWPFAYLMLYRPVRYARSLYRLRRIKKLQRTRLSDCDTRDR